jgi:hypothetical protein
MEVVASRNRKVPLGVPEPGAATATLAVKVTESTPRSGEAMDGRTTTIVEALPMVSVPVKN